jgi:hypothetical protein
VDQIGGGAWALFPDAVFLEPGRTYQARLAAGVCATGGPCLSRPASWSFTIAADEPAAAALDTRLPEGFPRPQRAPSPPSVQSVRLADRSRVVVTFSEPVMNVTGSTLAVLRAGSSGCGGPPLAGALDSDASGRQWVYRLQAPLEAGRRYCVSVGPRVYDLQGESLSQPYTSTVSPGPSP